MLTLPKLKNYLKLMIETVDPEELASLQQKYQSDIMEKGIYAAINARNNKYSPKGWNLLNHAIDCLTALDNPKRHRQDSQYKYGKILDILENELQLKKIGEGAFRNVYSSPEANFVVKVEQSDWSDYLQTMSSSGTNKGEYEKYFNYGPDSQPRTEMFPQLYAYDKFHGMWIISEKVKTFNENTDPNIYKIFKPFLTLLSQIADFIKTEPSFKNLPGSPLYDSNYREGRNLLFKNDYSTPEMFTDPLNYPTYIYGTCFGFARSLAFDMYTNSNPDVISAFSKHLIDWTLGNFGYGNMRDYQTAKATAPQKLKLFLTKFNQHFPNVQPTPDIAYFTSFLKNEEIEDLHFFNVGYRDMKNNPNQPWKNLVILDFGEYGGQIQTPSNNVPF